MRRMIGFALFFIAIGMLLAMILSNTFINSVIIITCVGFSYNLTDRFR